jgi:hypothetical protein
MATRSKTITGARREVPVSVTGAVRKESSESKDTPRFTKVHLRIHEIKCVKTTKEMDRDEITLAAIKVEGEVQDSGGKKKLAARAEKGDLLDAGKFKKGDTRKYKQPRTVLSFAAGDAGDKDIDWPRYYYATLLMIEEDEGTIGNIVNQAIKSVEKGFSEAVGRAANDATTAVLSRLATSAAVGSAIPVPLIGQAVGAAATFAVLSVGAEIKKSRKDDVFDPKEVHLELHRFPNKEGEFHESRGKKVFKGSQGHYVVTYSWAIS